MLMGGVQKIQGDDLLTDGIASFFLNLCAFAPEQNMRDKK
jgi:hypothetical protein